EGEIRKWHHRLRADGDERQVERSVRSVLVHLVEGRDPVVAVAVSDELSGGVPYGLGRTYGVAQGKRRPSAQRIRDASASWQPQVAGRTMHSQPGDVVATPGLQHRAQALPVRGRCTRRQDWPEQLRQRD